VDPGREDIRVAEPTVADLTKQLADLQSQVQSGQTALNITWTLITGFMVMFMQAGFALVETGPHPRQERRPHDGDELPRLFDRHHRLLGAGVRAADGGRRRAGHVRRRRDLSGEFAVTIAGKDFGLWGTQGFFLTPAVYTSPIAALFLFQMVFMDTTATIPTGAMAERWRFSSFVIFSFVIAAITYPIYANWVWGGGWLSALGRNFGLGHGHVDFAGSSVVHLVGGVAALVGAAAGAAHRQVRRDGKARRSPGTTSRWRCSARSSWRSAGSASTRARRCRDGHAHRRHRGQHDAGVGAAARSRATSG
jgi:Amt family ammonium transporter